MTGTIRIAGFGIIAIAAVAVFVLLRPQVPTQTPTLPSSTTYTSLISDALDADKSNNLLTQGAPQQAVVNGWTARDLLTIIAKENVDILAAQGAIVDATGTLNTTPFDERVPALLLIGVFAIAWSGLSAPRPKAAATAAPVTPEPTVWAPPLG